MNINNSNKEKKAKTNLNNNNKWHSVEAETLDFKTIIDFQGSQDALFTK